MTRTRNTPVADSLSRRQFLGTAAGAAAIAALPSSLAAQDINWKLACRYTTGGAPYRPAFAAMFFDPMFMSIEVGPSDLSPTGSVTIATRAGGGGRAGGAGAGRRGAAAGGAAGGGAAGGGAAGGGAAGAGAAGAGAAGAGAAARGAAGGGGAARGAAAPGVTPIGATPNATAQQMPPDIPIIPSGAGRGIGSLTTYSVSVVLLNDQTDWADTSRQSIQTAFDASQELLGVVVFHNAVADNQTWPLWYQELAGGLLVLNDHDGMKKSAVTRSASYDVHPVGTHPIVQDVAPFKVTGEDAYKGMWQSPKITPLLEATGSATDRVVAWIGPNPSKARIVVISPGTSPETYRNPNFRRLVCNSILWVGHRLD